ncbi:MAG: SDR family NAD(P)-dependent oxidoreductase [Nannocystaceae bacterium]|nr:SDR family oxidoreductase [Myxococcales bacterium]
MTQRSQRPLALVTGASRGIGRAIATALADTHTVVVTARSEAALASLVAALEDAGRGPALPLIADLGTAAGRAALLAALAPIVAARGPVVTLVNNAGIAHSAPIARTDDAAWTSLGELNLRAPFELCRALLPAMIEAGSGRVINVASTAALKGYRYTAAYAATKAGLVGMTRALAVEVADKGVTVNAVCPGFTDTDIVADAVANITAKTGRTSAQAREALARFSPQGRLRKPDEIAALVVFLASDAAAGITGQAIALDGGETA